MAQQQQLSEIEVSVRRKNSEISTGLLSKWDPPRVYLEKNHIYSSWVGVFPWMGLSCAEIKCLSQKILNPLYFHNSRCKNEEEIGFSRVN